MASVILCGKSPQIATSVIQGLQPEYDVVHVILTPEAGVLEIPRLLQGQTPTSSGEPNIGSRNYEKVPAAVVTGGGYDDEAFERMRKVCMGVSKVPWLRPDLTVQTPPLGPEYGKHMVGRVKACLKKLEEEGKGGEDAVVFF